MRRFSIAWLCVVVALALQGAAARAHGGLQSMDGPGKASYCRPHDGESADRRAPIGHGRHAADCISCEACFGGYSPTPTHMTDGQFVGPLYSSSAVWPADGESGARSFSARAHLARAPPVFS